MTDSRNLDWAKRILAVSLLVAVSTALSVLRPEIALGLALLGCTALAVTALSPRDRLPALLGAIAVLGLYMPTGIGSIDLALIVPIGGMVALLAETRRRRLPQARGWLLPASLVILALGLAVGMLRGPVWQLGARPMIILLWLVLIGRLSARWTSEDRNEWTLRAYSLTAAVFGVVNVLFLALPTLEDRYFATWISRVFVEPDSIRNLLSGDVLNNALSPYKAATLYINANVSAMFFGTAAWIGYGSWERRPARYAIVAGTALGAIATASRGGAAGFTASLVVWGLLKARRGSIGQTSLKLSAGALGVLGAGFLLSNLQEGGFSRFAWSVVTSDPRLILWGAAIRLGAVHPWAGSGFGAWERYWPPIAQVVNLRPSFPPHNAFLYLWIIGGALAVIGILGVGVAGLRMARGAIANGAPEASGSALMVGAVVGWCWMQGNFENLFFIDYRIGFALAVLLGALWATSVKGTEA